VLAHTLTVLQSPGAANTAPRVTLDEGPSR
jgi:hypothetical protein